MTTRRPPLGSLTPAPMTVEWIGYAQSLTAKPVKGMLTGPLAHGVLSDLRAAGFGREVGPGVYDIHSPRVPTSGEVATLLSDAAEVVDPARLWANSDCGLKTRGYAEVDPALRHMVEAAQTVRARFR